MKFILSFFNLMGRKSQFFYRWEQDHYERQVEANKSAFLFGKRF